VSCGAANSARLLLASANDKHPKRARERLGSAWAQLHVPRQRGRARALARSEPTVFQKTLALNDFYFSGGPDADYPLGNIQMVGKSQSPMFRGEKPRETMLAPHWTLDRIAQHAIDFWLSTEDLPRPDNRVTVDGDGKLTLAYKPTNDVPKEKLLHTLRSMLGKLDMEHDHLFHRFAYMKNDIPVAGCAHQAGTCRFGTDPADVGARRRLQGTRAGQPVRRRHELLPEHQRGQPALTAMANAIRVGDHLLGATRA
jgi:choline dehydrogenase-like flavoprotein